MIADGKFCCFSSETEPVAKKGQKTESLGSSGKKNTKLTKLGSDSSLRKKSTVNLKKKHSSKFEDDDQKILLLRRQSTKSIGHGASEEPFVKTVDFTLEPFLKDAEWLEKLKPIFQKEYFQIIEELLGREYLEGREIFPPKDLIFNAFNLTPLSKVKLTLLTMLT